MGEARDIHRLIDRRRDRIALSGNERRRNRTGIARYRGTNTLVDTVADAFDECRVTQTEALRLRRRLDLDPAGNEADRADLLEI